MAGSSQAGPVELVGLCWWWGGVRVPWSVWLNQGRRPKAPHPCCHPSSWASVFSPEFVLVSFAWKRVGSRESMKPTPPPQLPSLAHTPARTGFFLPHQSLTFVSLALPEKKMVLLDSACCWGPGVPGVAWGPPAVLGAASQLRPRMNRVWRQCSQVSSWSCPPAPPAQNTGSCWEAVGGTSHPEGPSEVFQGSPGSPGTGFHHRTTNLNLWGWS